MTIAVGDRIPNAPLHTMTTEGPKSVDAAEVLGSGTVVLFAVPGAFTPGCSNVHLPGFVERGGELREKGVDLIACVSVNDPFVMHAWGQAHGVKDDILMLADGNGEFTSAMGLQLDGTGFGLGMRSQRYAAVLRDGVISRLNVDAAGKIESTTCSNLLMEL